MSWGRQVLNIWLEDVGKRGWIVFT